MTQPLKAESAESELDAAIFTRITETIKGNDNNNVPIFSEVPEGNPFPYIRIGEKYSNDSFRTKTVYGESFAYTIHAFSKYKGTKEINSITAQIKAAITASYLTISGFNHTVTNVMGTRIIQDESGTSDWGYTHHAMIQFEFKILKA